MDGGMVGWWDGGMVGCNFLAACAHVMMMDEE